MSCLHVVSYKIGKTLYVEAKKVCTTSIGERYELFITADGFSFNTKDGKKLKVRRNIGG